MSWNLTQPNQLDLYSRNFNVKSLVADAFSALTLESDTIVSNTLQTTTGSNYLSLYSSSKVYKLNDIVLFNNILYRCLIDNTTGIAPNPASPSQAQWISLSSNNAIKNDVLYLQVSAVSGDDAKALLGPVPFKTIQAAVNFASNGAVINIIDNASTFTEAISIIGKSNITINGGIDGVYSQSGNVIANNGVSANIFLESAINISIRNVILQNTTPTQKVLVSNGAVANIYLDNVTFDTPNNDASQDILFYEYSRIRLGDVIFNSCRSKTINDTQFCNIAIVTAGTSGTQALSRLYVLNHIGPVGISLTGLTDATDANFLETYFYNCNKITQNTATGLRGKNVYKDCSFISPLLHDSTNAQANNMLIVSNSSLFNPATATYSALNKSGNAPYLLSNFDYDVSNVTALNGSGIGSFSNSTFGPSKYNNLIMGGGGGVNQNLTTGTPVVLVPSGGITYNPNSMGTYNSGTGELIIARQGVYQIRLIIEAQTSATANACQIVQLWGGALGSSPSTALTSASSYVTPFVSNVVTYPTVFVEAALNTTVATPNFSLYIYAQNTSATTFTARLTSVYVIMLKQL